MKILDNSDKHLSLIIPNIVSEKLNKKVGGSKTSSHKYGLAVDLKPVNDLIDEFFEFVKNYFIEKIFQNACRIENNFLSLHHQT